MELKDLHQLFLESGTVSTDTRKIEKDCFFFALKGPNFNGNQFAKQALEKGASYAVIDESKYNTSKRTILVKDVLETLQKLALYHRNYCNAKIISLTGSNGKTTTKELINAVLSKSYKTISTKGNLNNHIGVPLTLLSIEKDTEIAIIEMGANHQGEIAFLCGLAQPDYGYITNFGKAHLEGFGGVEGVIKGKSELYDFLIENNGYVFLNADDPIQKEKLGGYVKKFGFSELDHQFFNIKMLAVNPFVKVEFENVQVNSQLIGSYNFPNCCVAILMGKYFNVPPKSIKEALENYVPENNRSQILDKEGHQIILDAYNANPTSMVAALENFAQIEAKNKIVFLGDMFELGPSAQKEHQNIASIVDDLQLVNAFLVGENFAKVTSKYQTFNSFANFAASIDLKSLPKGHLLIKGSRGMAMERILKLL